MPRAKYIIWILAGALLCGMAFFAGRSTYPSARDRSRIDELAAENRQLLARLAESNRPAAAPETVSVPLPVVRQPERAPSPPTAQHTDSALHSALAEANANVAKLQGHLAELEAEVQNLSVDNKRLSASEADLNENLSSANRLIAALQTEVKIKADRVVQLEVAYQKMREQSGADARQAKETAQLVKEFEEIQRRRENYLNNILRRYREVTDQYRVLSAIMEERRHNDAAPAASPDLSRIQNTISMAEEDLRQFSGLNAQAQRIERKLTGR
jgi:DNA repair exonuclease SbcCD ATPase subunit